MTPAQQNAANLAMQELRQFQRRAYLKALAYTFVPGNDDASAGAVLKNIGDMSAALDQLEAHLGEVIGGLRSYEDWVNEAKVDYDGIAYQSGISDTFQAWDVLVSASEQTGAQVGELGRDVVAPAAIGVLTVVALVAVAYLVFTVRR